MDFDIVRAWKDEEYRNGLSSEQRAMLPENPAGMIDLSDEELGDVLAAAAAGTTCWLTAGCCNLATCWGFTECGAACTRGGGWPWCGGAVEIEA